MSENKVRDRIEISSDISIRIAREDKTNISDIDIATSAIGYDINDRCGIKHEWRAISSNVMHGELIPTWKRILSELLVSKEEHQRVLGLLDNLAEALKSAHCYINPMDNPRADNMCVEALLGYEKLRARKGEGK